MAVAGLAVVEVLEPVNVGVGKHAGGSRFGSQAGQGDISGLGLGAIDLELVNARLGIGGADDGEAQTFGGDGREAFDVSPSVDSRPQKARCVAGLDWSLGFGASLELGAWCLVLFG